MKRLLTLLLVLSTVLCANAQSIDHNKWMKSLDDNLFLWRLSIPASHDAATSGQSGAAKTQTYTIAQQLEKGVRMLDLRPRWDGSNMYIYHGITKTSVKFNDALQTMCTFLDNNPSEFLFVIMRHEEDGASDAQKKAWPTEMYNCLNAKRNYLIDYSPTLTVKEMRGKILIMSRNHYDNGPIGAYLEGGGDNSVYDRRAVGPTDASMNITTQDMYNVAGSGQLDSKVAEIKKMLDRSLASNESDYRLYFNHTSGYSKTFFGISTADGVQSCAKTCNKVVLDHTEGKTGPMGFILMDFAGDDTYSGQKLIDRIIQNNYNLMEQESDGEYVVRGEDRYLLPMGADKACSVRYVYKTGVAASSPVTRWYYADFDDSSWNSLQLPMGSKSFNAPYRHTWEGENNTYWVRREFNVEADETLVSLRKYILRAYHDDDYTIYVNGTRVHTRTGDNSWTNPGTPERIDVSKYIRPGRNVIATMIKQHTGGAYYDCGIIEQRQPDEAEKADAICQTAAPYAAGSSIYNLSGKRQESLRKGINILSGRKILVQ